MARLKSKKVQSKNIDSTEKQSAKTPSKSIGFGDTVEKFFEATGIKKAAKFILGEDCGCDKRKESLNKIWRYRNTNCLTESEYEWLTGFFAQGGTYRPSGKRKLFTIYNRVFNARQGDTTCKSCIRDIVNKMRKVHEAYND